MKRLIICGTGRCGTGYAAQLLRMFSVRIGHEGVFNPQNPKGLWAESSPFMADSSWLAGPFLEDHKADAYIVHLVRDPLKCIRSMAGLVFSLKPGENPYLDFKLRTCPDLRKPGLTPFQQAALFYILWNRQVQQSANMRVKIEDFDGIAVADILREAKLPDVATVWPENMIERAPRYVSKRYNTYPRLFEGFGLDGLPDWLRDELAKVAQEYGYGESPNGT